MKNQALRAPNQSGNVFFIILLGIALFAALSYAITQGMRGGSAKITEEKAQLAATEILNYVTEVRNGVKRLQISGIPLENISLQMSLRKNQDGTPIPTYLPNANCTSDQCRLFRPSGGDVKEIHFWQYGAASPSWPANSAHAGGVEFAILDINGIGTSLPEIVIKINMVDQQVCRALNKMVGLPEDARLSITPGKSFYHATVANYRVTNAHDAGYNLDSYLAGKMAFCDNNDRIIFLVAVAQ